MRVLSNHCPIILEIKAKDQGLKPFRCFNVWMSHHDFSSFVTSKWQSYMIEGWGGYVLKEKLKCLKTDLKQQHKLVFGSIDSRMENQCNGLHSLDILDDLFGLEDQEIVRRNEISARLLRDLKWKDSMLLQKSRCKWIKEGDINSWFFHGCINKRRKRNDVKSGFFYHFRIEQWCRPILDQNFSKKKISNQDNEMLISPFSEEEVKEVT